MPPTEPVEPDDAETASPSRRRLSLSIGAAVVLALVVLSGAVGLGILRGQAAPTATVPLSAPTLTPGSGSESGEASGGATGRAEPGGELYVHVLGAVTTPGLYVLDLDARVVDALAAAGGTTDDADLAAVNLARVLADGEQIVVPVIGAAVAEPGTGVAAPPGDGLVDLNTADQAALETLPRIGPALAERIIAWRDENGRFQSIEDLLAVPGIGEKMLEAIRAVARV